MTGSKPKTQTATTTSLLKSLGAVQAKLMPLRRNIENDFKEYKYAGIDQVFETIKPLLAENNLVVVQSVVGTFNEPFLETIVCHTDSGENMKSTIPLYMKSLDPQSFGSAMTYMRRYALMGLIGLTQADEDDDGATATNRQTTSTKSQAQAPRPAAQQTSKPQEIANHAPRRNGISDAQLKRLYSIAKSNHWTGQEVDAMVKKFYHCDALQLDREGYDSACNFVSRNAPPSKDEGLKHQINEPPPSFDQDDSIPF